jgi:hypothetical protein
MRICYLDESGDTATLPTATSPIQPAFIPAAVVFQQARIAAVTMEFLSIKERYYPNLMPCTGHRLDRIKMEIKGADVRRAVRSPKRKLRRQAIGFLDRIVDMLESHSAKIIGRVWIKGIGQPLDPRAIYTSSVQAICTSFQHLLIREDDTGLMIADSRSKAQNAQVAHSIFTQKFQTSGDFYDRILEMPSYGHSENHAGLQIADLLCSALLYPMATYTYCTGHLTSVHVQPGHSLLQRRYGDRLRRLQYRYHDGYRHRGGITVCDELGRRPGGVLFG